MNIYYDNICHCDPVESEKEGRVMSGSKPPWTKKAEMVGSATVSWQPVLDDFQVRCESFVQVGPMESGPHCC